MKTLPVGPKGHAARILHCCHDMKSSAHLGQDKTLQLAKQHYMWYQMSQDCREYVQSCSVCNKNKKSSVKHKAPLRRHHAGSPMERVHLDILGPFTPSEHGNVYVLVMIDQFTKWIECAALPNQTALSIAKKFLLHFIVTFESPLSVHTDQGRNFDGDLFKAMCSALQITKTRTSPYHPSSNWQVERYDRVLLQMIRCYIEGKVRNWDVDLPLLVMALHATENRSTGYTPNRCKVVLQVDIVTRMASLTLTDYEPDEWVRHLDKVMAEAHSFARKQLDRVQRRQKRLYRNILGWCSV